MRIKDGSTRSFNNGYRAKSTPRKRPRPIVRRWMKTHLKARRVSTAISSKRPIKPFSTIRVGTSRARGWSSKAFSLRSGTHLGHGLAASVQNSVYVHLDFPLETLREAAEKVAF